jgi:hypothetical protein
MANAPRATSTVLSTATLPNVIVSNPAKARNIGRMPHDRRHTGVRKKTNGIPAIMISTYPRNQRELGSLTPNGASKSTRHAGHFGKKAKISEETEDDSTEVSAVGLADRATIP